MDKRYFEENEQTDFEKLTDFNDFLRLNDFGKAPEKHFYDASGKTTLDKTISIEIKSRNQVLESPSQLSGCTTNGKSYTASTIFIEQHKLCDLLVDSTVNDTIPLYINFLIDGYVIVFNLKELKQFPNKVLKRIWSKGYQRWENEWRYELPLSEAYIYKKENNKWQRIH